MKMNLLRFFKLCRLVQFGSIWFILVQTHFPRAYTLLYIEKRLLQLNLLFGAAVNSCVYNVESWRKIRIFEPGVEKTGWKFQAAGG